MKLLQDRIKVRILPEDDKVGSLFVVKNPTTDRIHNYHMGIVEDVGTGRNFNGTVRDMIVKKGDKIMWNLGMRTTYIEDDFKTEYHIIYETDVMCVVND